MVARIVRRLVTVSKGKSRDWLNVARVANDVEDAFRVRDAASRIVVAVVDDVIGVLLVEDDEVLMPSIHISVEPELPPTASSQSKRCHDQKPGQPCSPRSQLGRHSTRLERTLAHPSHLHAKEPTAAVPQKLSLILRSLASKKVRQSDAAITWWMAESRCCQSV